MSRDGFDDEIWDEHKWEAHLNEIEEKSDQLRRFISRDPSGNLPRWVILLRENTDELDAVDAFIEEELQFEDPYHPEDYDDWEDDDFEDDLDDLFPFRDDFDFDEEEFLFDEDFDDFDTGEEWKQLSDDYAMSESGSIEMLETYNEARRLAVYVLQWAESVHPKYHTKEYNDFVNNILKIGAKIAGGYSFGFEIDFMGGNIALTKKGLYCANEALVLLQNSLKEAPYLPATEYIYLHERLFELRNDIGIYVQELREQFYSDLL